MTLARLIASGCGCGFVPFAPGTAASAVAVLSGALLMQLPQYALPVAVLAAALGGLWAVRAADGDDDPGWVVIDEIAGQWLALLGLARASIGGVLAAFLMFRLLDIAKPGPIGWADRQHGAPGVMADDLIAGALAACILWAIDAGLPGLLG